MILPSFINSRGILFQDDCQNVMEGIKSNAIDCIFADPPFNLKKPYNNYNDNLQEHKYINRMEEWIFESVRILKPGGSLFIYHIPYFLIKIASYLNTFPQMKFYNWIAINMKNGFPVKNRLHPAHYGLLYYVKIGEDNTFNTVRTQSPTCRHCGKLLKDYGGYRDKFKKWEDEAGIPWIRLSDYWEDTRPVRHDKKRADLNELPYEIAERVILMSTKKDDIVFDPFGGTGSTYYAASINERYWVGSEIGNVECIIKRQFDYKNEVLGTLPRKFPKIFKNFKKEKIQLEVDNYEKVLDIGLLYENEEKKKKKNRYSHRMSNKVLGD